MNTSVTCRFRLALAFTLVSSFALFGTGCTVDVVPVHFSKVNSAKFAEEPLLRGPTAPRAFKYAWKLDKPEGNLFDPSELAFSREGVRLRPLERRAGSESPTPPRERVGLFVIQAGPWYEALDSFRETTSAASKGLVRYQLSHDSSAWYYHGPKGWQLAGPTFRQANSAEEVKANLGTFHSEVGTGSLVLKVFLVAPTGTEPIELSSVEVLGIAPRMDGWN